ncbi:MAG: hypothetical protein L0Z62_43535, partial [Gemmataceae bacterium]|nr:hypothetical protein [Gemmataceae bacterium]
ADRREAWQEPRAVAGDMPKPPPPRAPASDVQGAWRRRGGRMPRRARQASRTQLAQRKAEPA